MRRTLGIATAILLATLAAGCGDDGDGDTDTANDPADSPSASPSETESEPGNGKVEFRLVEILSETAAGGEKSGQAVPIGKPAQLDKFVMQFEGDEMENQIRRHTGRAPLGPDDTLYGAVVAIGCNEPNDIAVQKRGDALEVTPKFKEAKKVECFAPVTSVAIFTSPA